MKKEIFKTIKGYSNYEISSKGRVRNSKTGKILISTPNSIGFLKLKLRSDETGKFDTMQVHRLVAEHFLPNEYNKCYVDHIDSNKYNNNVENLRWCTQAENCNFNNIRLVREKNNHRNYYDIVVINSGYLMEHIDYKQCIEYFSIKNPSQIAKRANNKTKSGYIVTFSK